jgi:hypothetical protein
MDKQKTATATSAVIKSILWSIGAVFAILGTIDMLAYSNDPTAYYIVAIVFGVLWALFAAAIRMRKRKRQKSVGV